MTKKPTPLEASEILKESQDFAERISKALQGSTPKDWADAYEEARQDRIDLVARQRADYQAKKAAGLLP